MAPFDGQPTQRQQIALALAPKFAASLSILGSSYIVRDCISASKRKQLVYHRLMLGLCVCDILMSVGLFTSTWPMPSATPNVWGASGTVASCEAVGFIEQAGVSATMYNGSLSIYYLLRVRYNWNQLRLKYVEIWLHSVPIIFGLATMIACLILDQFNSGIFDCWIAPFPQGCDQSWNSDVIDIPCERGDNASLYQWLFDLIPKWSSVLLVTVNMWLTYQGVRSQEESTRQFSFRGRPRVAERLARQSYFYVGALYLTYIPVIVTRVYELIRGKVHYEMLLTISITIPLQGFWNGMNEGSQSRRWLVLFDLYNSTRFMSPPTVLVYLRPRFLRQRERQRSERLRMERPTDPETSYETNNQLGASVRRGASRTTSIAEYLQAISTAVREGGLSDEDGDSETDSGVPAVDGKQPQPTNESSVACLAFNADISNDTVQREDCQDSSP